MAVFRFRAFSSQPPVTQIVTFSTGWKILRRITIFYYASIKIEEWLAKMNEAWSEIHSIFSSAEGYLGIDTSIAPLFAGQSSFLNFIKRMGLDFSRAVTTDFFIMIARYKKNKARRM